MNSFQNLDGLVPVQIHQIGHFNGLRSGTDPKTDDLSVGELRTGSGVRADHLAAGHFAAGFRTDQGLKALALQEGLGFLSPHIPQVLHHLNRRFFAQRNGDDDFRTLGNLAAALRFLMHDLSLLVGAVILLGLKADFEIGVFGHQLIAVFRANEVRHLHQIPILVQQRSVEHRQQEGADGQYRHDAAHNNGNGGNPVPFLPFALFLPLPRRRTAHGVGILADGGTAGACVLAHPRTLLGHPAGGLSHRRCDGAVFGIGHTLGCGSGIGLLHPPDGNGMLRRGRGLILKIDGRILAELLHILQHFRCGSIAVLGIQGHALENDLFQAQGNVGIQG